MAPNSIINLNKARKALKRVEKRKQADENARKFGRSKADVEKNKAQKSLDTKRVDDHKLDP